MPDYWVDTDGLIAANNHGYAFDLVPQFWGFLVQMAKAGNIASPIRVYGELTEETYGPLRDWAVENRDIGFFIEASEKVQRTFTKIADHVLTQQYKTEHAQKFLDGADPWLIAHAKTEGGLVVTNETVGQAGAKKPKIPNICNKFGVGAPIQIYEMARRLKFKP